MKRIRDKKFREWLSNLPCLVCKRPGPSQAAHVHLPMQKTLGDKEDDKNCVPLCADRPGADGCHTLLDGNKRVVFWTYERKEKARALGGRLYLIYKNSNDRAKALMEIVRF